VNAGETYRVFIVSTNHSTINVNTVTGDRVVFLDTTTGGAGVGQVLVTANVTSALAQGPSANALGKTKYINLNQLSMWGAIVIPSSSTGFAMEFVGDAHDSAQLIQTSQTAAIGAYPTFQAGRGVN